MRTCTIDQTVHTETWSTLTRLVLVDTWAHVCSPGCARSRRCDLCSKSVSDSTVQLSHELLAPFSVLGTMCRSCAKTPGSFGSPVGHLALRSPSRAYAGPRAEREHAPRGRRPRTDRGGARRSREAFRDSWRGRTWAKAYLLRLFAHLTPPLAWLTLLTSGLAGSSDPLLTWGGAARTGAHLTPLLTWLTRGSPRRTVVPGCKRFMHSNCVRQLGDIN